MSLNDSLKSMVDNVDGALGCAVVDTDSGLILGVNHSVPYFTQSYLDAVAAAAVELFAGSNVRTVEKLLNAQRGDTATGMINEIQMTTDNTFHFMATIPEKPNSLVVLITSKKTNLGMGWTFLRKRLKDVEPFCP